MPNIVNKGSLLPPEIVRDMINLVRGKSSLARLSAARPVSFNGNEYFTYIEEVAAARKADIERRLSEMLDVNNCTLSVVNNEDEGGAV